MRERAITLVRKLRMLTRSDVRFIALVILIIAAAVLSFSYAYLNNRDSAPVAEATPEVTAPNFETFEEVLSASDSPAPDPSAQEPAPTPNPVSSEAPPKTESEIPNCKLLNDEANLKIEQLSKQLRTLTLENLRHAYLDIKKEYEHLKTAVTKKGCKPGLILPELSRLLR